MFFLNYYFHKPSVWDPVFRRSPDYANGCCRHDFRKFVIRGCSWYSLTLKTQSVIKFSKKKLLGSSHVCSVTNNNLFFKKGYCKCAIEGSVNDSSTIYIRLLLCFSVFLTPRIHSACLSPTPPHMSWPGHREEMRPFSVAQCLCPLCSRAFRSWTLSSLNAWELISTPLKAAIT